MLHDRMLILLDYVKMLVSGESPRIALPGDLEADQNNVLYLVNHRSIDQSRPLGRSSDLGFSFWIACDE